MSPSHEKPPVDTEGAVGVVMPERKDDQAGDPSRVSDGRTYRTYKRRWFGVVQLVLLNIVVSWDVRSPPWLTVS